MKTIISWFIAGIVCLYAMQSFAQFNSGFAQGPGNPLSTAQVSSGGVNWVGANITASGVNWASLRALFGNTATSTNWQAFGV